MEKRGARPAQATGHLSAGGLTGKAFRKANGGGLSAEKFAAAEKAGFREGVPGLAEGGGTGTGLIFLGGLIKVLLT